MTQNKRLKEERHVKKIFGMVT